MDGGRNAPTRPVEAARPIRRELKPQGLGPFAVGAVGELSIALVTLVMVLVAAKAFNL